MRYLIIILLYFFLFFSVPAYGDVYPLFFDVGLPDRAEIFSWSAEGPNVAIQDVGEDTLDGEDTPEGCQFLRISVFNNSTNWAGWGVFFDRLEDEPDLRGYASNGVMKFWVKSATDLNVEIEYNRDQKSRIRAISAYGWNSSKPDEWQEVAIPISAFALTATQLSAVRGPFLITAALAAGQKVRDFSVDHVRWEKPLAVPLDVFNPAEDPLRRVEIEDGRLFLDGQPFVVQGVAAEFIPVGRGSMYAWDLEPDNYTVDLDLLEQMGVNVVRLYKPPVSGQVLDEFYRRGIYVLMTYPVTAQGEYRDERRAPAVIRPFNADFSQKLPAENLQKRVLEMVEHWGKHPAVLAWGIGNEVNTHMDRSEQNVSAWYAAVDSISAAIKDREIALNMHQRVVTTANAEDAAQKLTVDIINYDTAIENMDFWSVQLYRGETFGDLFEEYINNGVTKPLLISEFGCDAYDSRVDEEDQQIQAETVDLQMYAIAEKIKSENTEGPLLGSILFAWRDGWWKDGNNEVHDTGCSFFNDGYMDSCINEEWWGVAGIVPGEGTTRVVRDVFYYLKDYWNQEVFTRGNANCDSQVDIADAVFILNYLFASGPAPSCSDAADTNDDGVVDISDVVKTLLVLFAGREMPAPFGNGTEVGVDGTLDRIKCFASCPVSR